MARDLKRLFSEAFDLPESERAALAGLLIESLEPPPDPDADEACTAVAERRWRETESGSAQTVPWEDVKAKLNRRK